MNMFTNNQLANEIRKSKSVNYMTIGLMKMIDDLTASYVSCHLRYKCNELIRDRCRKLCKYELYNRWDNYILLHSKMEKPIQYYMVIIDNVIGKNINDEQFNITRLLKIKKIRKIYE
jgi:hypothetical protein